MKTMRARGPVALVLLCSAFHAQKGTQKGQSGVIERAKQAIISNFDPALPKITLESFLRYETENAPTDWKTTNCNEYPVYLADTERGNALCVDAYSTLRDQRVLTIVLGLTRDRSNPPKLLSVAIITSGLEHPLQLIQVPAAIHQRRFKPPSVRDLLPLNRVS